MLFDEQLARAQRAYNQPDGFRAGTQADARQLRKALRRARRRRGSVETPPTFAEPAIEPAVPVEAPAPATAGA